MNICSYQPTKYLDDKGYNDRFRLLFHEVCYLKGRVINNSPNVISGTTYTLQSLDVNNIYTNAAGCTVTVPAGIPLSHCSYHTCIEAASITFVTDGTTINNYNGDNSSNGQFAVATLFQSSQDVFILGGNTQTL